MAVIFGRNAFVQVGEESTWGTGVATPVNTRVLSVDLSRSQERSQSASLSTGTAGYSQKFFDGFELTGGTLDTLCYYEGSGIYFKAALGSVATTGAGPTYVHTYTPTLDLPSLTCIFQRGSGSSEKFLGMKISSLSLSVEAGGEASLSMDVIGKTADARTGSVTATFGAGRQVLHYEAGQLSWDSKNYDLRSMTLTVDNKLERRNLLGSKLTAEPATNDIREVTLEVTADVESATENDIYNSSISGTQEPCTITFTNTDSDIMEIKLFNAVILSYSDSISSVGRVERTWTLQGYSDASNPSVHIKITNQQSSAIAN